MSKLTVGQKATLHVSSAEHAATKSIHMLDEDTQILGEVVYVNEDGTVNIVVHDHVGTSVPLKDIQTTKPKDDNVFYVSAVKA
jgi:hypothetical protein